MAFNTSSKVLLGTADSNETEFSKAHRSESFRVGLPKNELIAFRSSFVVVVDGGPNLEGRWNRAQTR